MKENENVLVVKVKKQNLIIAIAACIFLIIYGILIRHSYFHGVFGLLVLFFVLRQILFDSRTLTLSPEGLAIGAKRGAQLFKWQDIEGFELKGSAGFFASKSKRIVFNVASPHSPESLGIRIRRELTGFGYEIRQGYELGTEELLNALNDWKRRFAQGAGKAESSPMPATVAASAGASADYSYPGSGRMLEAKERELLDKGLKFNMVIWAAMLGSLGVYIIVCHIIGEELKITTGKDFPLSMLRTVLFIIAIAEFGIIHFLRKAMLVPSKWQSPSGIRGTDFRYYPANSRYTTAHIVSLALAESIAIYGVVLFFLSKDFRTLYIFTALGAAAMFIYRPKMDELEKLALDMKRG